MIKTLKTPIKRRLTKQTIEKIRLLARKGSDLQLENFIFNVSMNYIADVRGTDVIDEAEYINVAKYNYECECPNCHEMIKLFLKEDDDVQV